MDKESAICAIGMVKLPFVINLKLSRALEGKTILKLPRPTLFSRSESVNNRLRSLCNKTDRVGFIDVRQKLDRCQFGGLVRDAIHYNRPGAAQALKLIKDSAKDFLV